MLTLLDQRMRQLATQRNQVHCIDAFDLLRLLPDHSVDMILTDMPYGTTACAWDTVIDLDAWWQEAHRVAKPRAAIVCTGSQPFTSRLVMSNIKRFKYSLIWEKDQGTNFLNAPYQPLKIHEDLLVFSEMGASFTPAGVMNYYPQMKAGQPYTWNSLKVGGYTFHSRPEKIRVDNSGTRYPNSILEFSQVRGFHPTQKPVALFEYLIRTYTQPGDLVLDPFVGSGTTALAARACGRDYICGDQSAEYVAIARDRLRLPFEPRQVQQDTRLDDLPLFAARPDEPARR